MKIKTRLRILFPLSLVLASLVFFFNNCSYNYKIDKEINSVFKTELSSGNGYGYGGKLATYNRYLPDFNCDSQPTAFATIQLSADSAQVTERASTHCSPLPTGISIGSIDSSQLQSDVIGYKLGMFMSAAPDASGIPDKLAEAWCRDDKNSNVDVITYYDRSRKQSFGKVYYRDSVNTSSIISSGEFNASRLIAQHQISYAAPDFRLHIDRDEVADISGTFWGNLFYNHNGSQIQKRVFCRLGGDLDPQIWPVQQVNETLPVNSFFEKTSNTVYYTSMMADFSMALFSWRNGENKLLFDHTTQGLQISPADFLKIKDNKFYFRTYGTYDETLYSFDLSGKISTAISTTPQTTTHGVESDYYVDPKNPMVFFRSDQARTSIFGHTDLYVFNTLTGVSKQISHALPDDLGSEVVRFTVGAESGAIAYEYKDSRFPNELNLALLSSPQSIPQLIDLRSQGISFVGFGRFIANDSYLIFNGRLANSDTNHTFALSLLNLTIKEVRNQTGNTSSGVSLSAPNGQYLIYAYTHQAQPLEIEYFVRDTKTWNEISLGLSDLVALRTLTINEQSGIAVQVKNGEVREINLSTGSQSAVCLNQPGEITKWIVANTGASNIFVIKSRPLGGQFEILVYQLERGSCRQLNSIPASSDGLYSPILAPDNSALLLGIRPIGKEYTGLIHMPFDGKPPVQLNAPHTAGAGVLEATYMNNGRSVVYQEIYVGPDSRAIYMVNIPLAVD